MKFKFDIKKYILVIIAALVCAGAMYAGNKVLITTFEQLLYGLIKIKGGGSTTIGYGVMYIFIAFIIICPILLLPVIDFGKKFAINIKNKSFQLYPIKNIRVYGILLIVFSVIGLFYVFEFFPYVKNTLFSNTKIFDEYYIESSNVDIEFPKDKKNLIYIFVESLESSNISVKNGGLLEHSVVPNLEKMALENINFSNTDKIGGAYQTDGTNWTAGAIIAHTSGVPLKVTMSDFAANSIKFSNVTSISDILAKNGYSNYMLMGSDASFGGRRGYLANHNYLIKDYYTAINDGIIEDGYYEWWGYEDSKMFEYAKMLLEDISNDDKPFNFTMLTANTHFTDGYVEKTCENKFDDAYANSFYCSDHMIYEFIEWLKTKDFYDDTVIVIVGDHLTMQDGFYDKKDSYDRTVYNVFINANVDGGFNNKNRVFTTMDLFPTTLAALGADIEGDRLGLGTNLFSDKETISEMLGFEEFNLEISKSSTEYYDKIRK